MKIWIDAGQTTFPTLLLQHYRSLNLTNDELILILQLKTYIDQGEPFPDLNVIAQNMKLPKENIFRAIHQLIQKKILTIETSNNEMGVSQDAYSFDLLWERLFQLLNQNLEEQDEIMEQEASKNLYTLFEGEFGRPLSPIEMETLVIWIEEDGYKPELIKLALREAVLNQVYNFKYIDRILLSWEKKNIRTKEQVEKESNAFREKQSPNPKYSAGDKKPSNPVPMVNWLDNDTEGNE